MLDFIVPVFPELQRDRFVVIDENETLVKFDLFGISNLSQKFR